MGKIKLFLFASLLMQGIVACNIIVDTPEVPDASQSVSGKWQVSIPAVKGGGAATKALEFDALNKKVLTSFETTDNIYVYNKTKNALDASCLKPESAGTSVTLSGMLAGDYEEGDVLELRYAPYCPFGGGVFDYEEQDGTFETIRDFGVATVTVTAVDELNHTMTTGNASFTNPYSIFRFTFVNEGGDPIPIYLLWINSPFGKLVFKDAPDGTREYYGSLNEGLFPRESFRNNSTDPVWLSICIEAPGDPSLPDGLQFDIEDWENKIVYDMYKPGDGKITNGKFYAPTIQMMALPKPDVTLTASGDPVEPTEICGQLEMNNYYTYVNPGSDITVGGESGDQTRFRWNSGGSTTMRLKQTVMEYPQVFVCDHTVFIEHLGSGVLTLDLNGNTSVFGRPDDAVIHIDYGYHELVFQGNGTLTVTSSNTVGTKGVMLADAGNQKRDGIPDVHAAAGYSLDISEGVDNGDGTSTWVYTVAPL